MNPRHRWSTPVVLLVVRETPVFTGVWALSRVAYPTVDPTADEIPHPPKIQSRDAPRARPHTHGFIVQRAGRCRRAMRTSRCRSPVRTGTAGTPTTPPGPRPAGTAPAAFRHGPPPANAPRAAGVEDEGCCPHSGCHYCRAKVATTPRPAPDGSSLPRPSVRPRPGPRRPARKPSTAPSSFAIRSRFSPSSRRTWPNRWASRPSGSRSAALSPY